MSMFQTGYQRRPAAQVYPGKGKRPKAAKNKPEVLQSYVTYDTVPAGAISGAFSSEVGTGSREENASR
jgi:hypothetical protein